MEEKENIMDMKLKINRVEAVQVYECVKAMTGSASYQLLRQQVLKKIEELWPEILKNDSPTDPEDVRELVVNPREQRSLAEGYVGLLNKRDQFGGFSLTSASFDVIQKAAKSCKVWNWVKTQVNQEEVAEFDQPLDDEPPVSDDETPTTD